MIDKKQVKNVLYMGILTLLFLAPHATYAAGERGDAALLKAEKERVRFLPNMEVLDSGITLLYSNDFKCSDDFGRFAKNCKTNGITKIQYVKNIIRSYLQRMPEGGKEVIVQLKKNQPMLLLFSSFEDFEKAFGGEAENFFEELTRARDGNFNAQDLYAEETFVSHNESKGLGAEGVRNAALEEILHLIHNYGITPAYPQWQKRLDAATARALKNKMLVWEDKNKDGIGDDENALPRGDLDDEYLTEAVEAYYDQRGGAGYVRSSALCPSPSCAKEETLKMLQNKHGEIYALIQEMLGEDKTIY